LKLEKQADLLNQVIPSGYSCYQGKSGGG